jgi:hypothetical protein
VHGDVKLVHLGTSFLRCTEGYCDIEATLNSEDPPLLRQSRQELARHWILPLAEDLPHILDGKESLPADL